MRCPMLLGILCFRSGSLFMQLQSSIFGGCCCLVCCVFGFLYSDPFLWVLLSFGFSINSIWTLFSSLALVLCSTNIVYVPVPWLVRFG
ncbi:hypothetical protein QL285_015392 [Trifolium repens]|nr:hypothetical protein QL285_015392 [Trifolium repens]